MATPRDKYHTELFRTIIDFNDCNSEPLSNENILNEMYIIIAEYAHNITSDTHNLNVNNFSQKFDTQRENKNTILISEKRDKSDELE